MLRATVFAISLAVAATVLAVQEVPPGHPPIAPPASQPAVPQAEPADVTSIEAIVLAYYDSLSAAKGAPRDWDRFRSLFIPEARFVTVRMLGNHPSFVVLSPEQFVARNRRYFERGGYYERQVHQRVDRFGNMAQVFSTYEARQSLEQAEPYSRGINSIQLISDGSRWWIATILWDYERPDDGNPLPAEYLPTPVAPAGG